MTEEIDTGKEPEETPDTHMEQLEADLTAAGFSAEPETVPEETQQEETPPTPPEEKKAEDAPAAPEDDAGTKQTEQPPPEEQGKEEQPPVPQQPRLEQAAQAFNGLVRIMNGTAPEGVTLTAEQGRRFIEETFTPAEIALVRKAAQAGRFGEESPDVLALADEVMPVVIATEPLNAQRRQQEEGAARFYREGEAELTKLYPEWNKKDSEDHKTVSGYYTELARLIPNLDVLPSAPKLVVAFAQLKTQAGRTAALEAELKAEKERSAALEKRFGGGLPNRGTSGSHGGKRGSAAEEQLRSDLKQLGFE